MTSNGGTDASQVYDVYYPILKGTVMPKRMTIRTKSIHVYSNDIK